MYPNPPADPGDVRFEIVPLAEPEMGCTHLVRVIDDKGELVESFTTDNPYGAVEACREVQSMSMEERFDYYARMGW